MTTTWTVEDINVVADVIRTYLTEECPDVHRQLFNQDVEEIAMRVWPVVENRLTLRAEARAVANVVPTFGDDTRYEYEECGCCSCCSQAGCVRGERSECPHDTNGESLCPCTETS